jgi:hypothetical protein
MRRDSLTLQITQYFRQPTRDSAWGRVGVIWSVVIALANALTGNIANGLLILNSDDFTAAALRDWVSRLDPHTMCTWAPGHFADLAEPVPTLLPLGQPHPLSAAVAVHPPRMGHVGTPALGTRRLPRADYCHVRHDSGRVSEIDLSSRAQHLYLGWHTREPSR